MESQGEDQGVGQSLLSASTPSELRSQISDLSRSLRMLLAMEPKVSRPRLPQEVDQAKATRRRAQVALVTLAEALVTPDTPEASGTPDTLSKALDKAEAVLSEAQLALKDLDRARKAMVAPEVALAVTSGTSGVSPDEDEEELRRRADEAEAMAEKLQREREELCRCQRRLWAGHGVAMGLMALGTAVLSLDSARAALGVAEDCHLLLALGAVALSCQVALRGLGTSRRHLLDAIGQHRAMAQRLRDRAWRVVTSRATAEATAATNKAIAAARGRLEEVTDALGTLVAAVGRDREVTTWGTRGQRFPASARALGDIVVALGTWRGGDEEVTPRLKEAQKALAGQG